MSQSLADKLSNALRGLNPGACVYIAYSGGLDSQVLLHVATAHARLSGVDIAAVHLNHGLSPNANAWQAFCAAQCQALDIPLLVHAVELKGGGGGNVEQRARDARYAWFESLLENHDRLLMAHHQDDQAETVLLRLLRGSGTRGLAAIPGSRVLGKGRLIRPFLDASRLKLQQYAKQHGLDWVEDESNDSIEFDRNFIRHHVMPAVLNRWPQASRQLARSAENCQAEQALLDELAALDAGIIRDEAKRSCLELLPALDLGRFKAISQSRQRNLLQYLLVDLMPYPAPADSLNEWLRQVNKATPASRCQLDLSSVTLLLHDECLCFISPVAQQVSADSLVWKTSSPIEVIHNLFHIELVEAGKAPPENADTIRFEPGDTVTVHWREGGERVKLPGEKFSRSLKKLFQEKRLAPWLRRSLPMISVDGYIVWSAALGDFSPRLVGPDRRLYSFNFVAADPCL